MANLKVVIQHHSTQLVETFKRDLVGFSNGLWQCGIVTETVKDSTLDTSKGDEYLRASNLVSCVSKTISPLDEMKQIDHMKQLLKILEREAEGGLADCMRKEIKRISGVLIPPTFTNPTVEDSMNRYNQSEPANMQYYLEYSEEAEDFGYLHMEPHEEPSNPFSGYLEPTYVMGTLDEPQRLVGLPNPTLPVSIRKGFVYPQASSPRSVPHSEPAQNTYNWGKSSWPRFGGGQSALKRQQRKSKHSSFDSTASEYAQKPEDQKYLAKTPLIQKYETDISDLRKTLKEKEKEHDDLIETMRLKHEAKISELNQQIITLKSDLNENKEIVRLINNIELLANEKKILQEHEKSIRKREAALLEREKRLEPQEKGRNRFYSPNMIYHVFIVFLVIVIFWLK